MRRFVCYTQASMPTEGDEREGRRAVRPVAIVGPTAVGKTAVGIEVAERLQAEIISADSMAIYRGMDIGTAKPAPEEREQVRFHMLDVVDPDQPFTVAHFQRMAADIMEGLLAAGRCPLLVGGTGLYVRAVLDGLDIPSAGPDPQFRRRMSELAETRGRQHVHDMLGRADALTAARLHPNDLKRVIRALEVYERTGLPMSQLHRRLQAQQPMYPEAVRFGLTMDRRALYERIERRVDEQVQRGLVEEVAALLRKGYSTGLPAMQGLGYKELAAHIEGKRSLEQAIQAVKQSTRRFAKRQLTWFRADARVEWIDMSGLSPAEAADRITNELRN